MGNASLSFIKKINFSLSVYRKLTILFYVIVLCYDVPELALLLVALPRICSIQKGPKFLTGLSV